MRKTGEFRLEKFWPSLRKGCLISALVLTSTRAHAVTANGFVTASYSQKNFDLGRLGVVMGHLTVCQTQRLSSDIRLTETTHKLLVAHRGFVLRSFPAAHSLKATSCDALSWPVGTRVAVTGSLANNAGVLSASKVVIYSVAIRQTFAPDLPARRWESGALLEESPQIAKTAGQWTGNLWLDGYPMHIDRDTALLADPPGTQLAYRPFSLFGEPFLGDLIPHHHHRLAFSPDLLRTNSWAAYRGVGRVNGRVLLYRLVLWKNQASRMDKHLDSAFSLRVLPPLYGTATFGKVLSPRGGGTEVAEILPDRYVQEFISLLGDSLVPEYQKQLPATDATKVHFQFYVVGDIVAKRFMNPPLAKNAGVFASPTGTILVPQAVLLRMKDEAQVAAILSGAITSVLQHQESVFRHSRPIGVFYGGSYPDLSPYVPILLLKEQSIRIGIRQMYLVGFDIREAPFAWSAARGEAENNPDLTSQANRRIPWDAAYAFEYIRGYYSSADFGRLKRGRNEYQRFLQKLNEIAGTSPTSAGPSR